ncbi:hypothetical protein DRN75_02230 [Nanoarchaeota archaeon]|nr:MAG: hypothetical protein DRN75_02230 [Nanoarchaeota archaeon]
MVEMLALILLLMFLSGVTFFCLLLLGFALGLLKETFKSPSRNRFKKDFYRDDEFAEIKGFESTAEEDLFDEETED